MIVKGANLTHPIHWHGVQAKIGTIEVQFDLSTGSEEFFHQFSPTNYVQQYRHRPIRFLMVDVNDAEISEINTAILTIGDFASSLVEADVVSNE